MAECPSCGADVGNLPEEVIARVCTDCLGVIKEAVCRHMGVSSFDELPSPPEPIIDEDGDAFYPMHPCEWC
jgi:hypothetical protein